MQEQGRRSRSRRGTDLPQDTSPRHYNACQLPRAAQLYDILYQLYDALATDVRNTFSISEWCMFVCAFLVNQTWPLIWCLCVFKTYQPSFSCNTETLRPRTTSYPWQPSSSFLNIDVARYYPYSTKHGSWSLGRELLSKLAPPRQFVWNGKDHPFDTRTSWLNVSGFK